MITSDPTLYGATFPNRELPFVNPYSTPFFGQQVPWSIYGQQSPWSAYGQQFPMPAYGQQLPMPVYGQQLPMPVYGQQLPMPVYGQPFPWTAYGKVTPPMIPTEGAHSMPPFVGNRFAHLPWAPLAQNCGAQFKWPLTFVY